MHRNKSPLAEKTLKIKDSVPGIGGSSITIQDWFDRSFDVTWGQAEGLTCALDYAWRIGVSKLDIPPDNEVLYGMVEDRECLIHVTELEINEK